MEWNGEKIWQALLSGGFITALTAIIAKKMDWVRFGRKDRAEVQKIEAETLAKINAKRIEDEVKISANALEWSAKIWAQLEKANNEIDRLYNIISRMRDEMQKLEDELDETRSALNKDRQELENLRNRINGD